MKVTAPLKNKTWSVPKEEIDKICTIDTGKEYTSQAKICFTKDVRSAVEWLKLKVRQLSNRDDWLQDGLPVARGVLDGGGVGRVDVIKLIDEAFEDVTRK